MATYAETATFEGDGDFDDNANWKSGSPNSGAFDVTGSSDLDQGLDQSANTYTTVAFTDGYSGTIGSSGTPFQLVATTLYMNYVGPEAYIDENITNVFVHMLHPNGTNTNAFVYGGVNASTAGVFVVTAGHAKLGANATATVLEVNGAGMVTTDSGSTITTGAIVSGKLVNKSTTTTMNVGGGTVFHDLATTTTVNIYGGRYILRKGTATTINLRGGVLDMEQGSSEIDVDTINWYGGELLGEETRNLTDSASIIVRGRGLRYRQGTTVTLS